MNHCSIFVPLPAIVVKSHQTLEAILPYLPLSLKSAESQPSSPRPRSPALHPATASTSLVVTNSSPSPLPPPSHHHSHRRNGNNHHHTASTGTHSTNETTNTRKVSSNQVSPDCSIPATTCIKISLQPTPTFKLVKPRCPHTAHRAKNRQHYLQQQQQQHQQQQQLSLPPSESEGEHSHSHRFSRRLHYHSRSSHHHHHDNGFSEEPFSQSHSHSPHHHHHHRNSYSHSPNHPRHPRNHPPEPVHHRHHQRSYSSMAALEYHDPQHQKRSADMVSVLFTFPFNYKNQVPKSVQVIGSFNSWESTQPMSKNLITSQFETTIELNIVTLAATEGTARQAEQHKDGGASTNKIKILFKFILDGQDWVTDPKQTLERDRQGNLNNILFLTIPAVASGKTASASTSNAAPIAASASTAEAEDQRLARLKREAEDDAVIRQLGGGIWGAPLFAVNDPPSLPEHFVESSYHEAQQNNDAGDCKVKEKMEAVDEIASITADTSCKQEGEDSCAKVKVAEEHNDDEKIIRELGGGMWGAPMFAVNDPVALPDHFTEVAAAEERLTAHASNELEVALVPAASGLSSESDCPETPVPTLAPSSFWSSPEAEEEEEDENDKIIRALGGGMWGAPNFQVNDPASLPEHFREAVLGAEESNMEGINNFASATSQHEAKAAAVADSSVSKVESVAEKDIVLAPSMTNSSSSETVVKGQVTRDESSTTVAGSLIETEVETTEDVVVQAPDGTILEETIITDVQETVEGQLQESVTHTTEIIEEIEEPMSAEAEINPKPEHTGVVTMVEDEKIKLVQGEDGVERTIMEDTVTFMDGPEVDSSSLHSLSTSIKPLLDGESVLVEQAPSVHLDSVEILNNSGQGDAKPSMDLFADIVPSNLSNKGKNFTGDEYDGDGDYGVVVLHGVPLTAGEHTAAGDAKPSVDLSAVAQPMTSAELSHPLAMASPVVASKTLKPASKGEKRKSVFWKKVKKVLS
ncbi:hypothetical protein BG004_005040 [Podila humilis]|nr:hypothetical protein BG004_005040 [Podila humilis]